MAQVQLWLYEAYLGNLPEVCVRCGKAATHWRLRSFFTGPPFVLAPGKIWVCLPFCQRHKNHWLWRVHLGVGFGCLPPLLLIVYPWCLILSPNYFGGGWWSGLFGLGFLGFLVLWPMLLVALKLTSVLCLRYNKSTVTLAGIAPKFIEQLMAKRRVEEEALKQIPKLSWEQLQRPPHTPLSSEGVQELTNNQFQSKDEHA